MAAADDLNMDIAAIIKSAITRACGDDHSKFIGRCTEAQIVAFKALADAGVTSYMVCGNYRGDMDEAATELFGGSGCMHSWVRTEDGRIIDPTAWVFHIETTDPAVTIIEADDPRAANYDESRGFATQMWREDFGQHLAVFGMVLA